MRAGSAAVAVASRQAGWQLGHGIAYSGELAGSTAVVVASGGGRHLRDKVMVRGSGDGVVIVRRLETAAGIWISSEKNEFRPNFGHFGLDRYLYLPDEIV